MKFGLTCSKCGVADSHDNDVVNAFQHDVFSYLEAARQRGWSCDTHPVPKLPKCPKCV